MVLDPRALPFYFHSSKGLASGDLAIVSVRAGSIIVTLDVGAPAAALAETVQVC